MNNTVITTNIKLMLKQSLIWLMLLHVANSYAQKSTSPTRNVITPSDISSFIGKWQGTLTYLDYTTGKPFTMHANLIGQKDIGTYRGLLLNTLVL